MQRGVQLIGNVGGREGERSGKAKNGLFALVEMWTGFELRDVAQLLFGDLRFSADGRVDVNSKRTPNHQCDLELGEFFQAHRNRAPGSGVEVHADGPPKVFRVESSNAHAAGNAAEGAFREPKKKASQQTGFVVLDAFESRHRLTSNLRSCHGPGFIQHVGSHHAALIVEMNERSTPLFEMTKVQEDPSLRD